MLFDRSRTLFEHGHDESRHRGVPSDAGGNYREGCRSRDVRASRSSARAAEVPVHRRAWKVRTPWRTPHISRLTRRQSYYAAVFAGLVPLTDAEADQSAVAEMLAQPDDDQTDLETLDEVWEKSGVIFGPDPSSGEPQVRNMCSGMDTPVILFPQHAAE